MYRLLLVALVIGFAFVASAFFGSVLERRAQDRRAMQEHESPAIAVTPSGPHTIGEIRP